MKAEMSAADDKHMEFSTKLAEALAETRKAELAKEELQSKIEDLRDQAIENEKELHERGEALRETRFKLDALLEERHREGLELGTRLNERELHVRPF